MTTKQYPAYKEAATQIVKRVEKEGYGFVIEHEEIRKMLCVELPDDSKGQEAYKAYTWALCEEVVSLQELLLDEHYIYLLNVRGFGYQVLSPPEQIRKGFSKHAQKMRVQLNKALKAVVNVNRELLTIEDEKERQEKITKMTFIRRAIMKRKILPFEPRQIKEIEDKNSETYEEK